MPHALLSASGAKRWMMCPPSALLESQAKDTESVYAAEGTLAHSLAELMLRYNNNEMTKRTFTTRFGKLKQDPLYSQEMQDHIENYATQVWEIANETRMTNPDALVLFEQCLDFSEYVPEGFGTGDVVIVADDTVHIIDLKYGKGVGVVAQNNPQTRLYGLGAYLEYSMLYNIDHIRMTIIQPRLENTTTEEMSVDELLAWAESEVRPKAQLALTGEGEFAVGDHCQFCKVRATCRKRAEHNLELAKFEFADPALLSNLEIGGILGQANALAHWVKDVTDYALAEALKGTKYVGWKLVEGQSRRKYADQTKIADVLSKDGWTREAIYTPEALIGINDMTRLLGKKKFDELLGEYVIKPTGAPTLAPESDSRPELGSTSSAKKDFTIEIIE